MRQSLVAFAATLLCSTLLTDIASQTLAERSVSGWNAPSLVPRRVLLMETNATSSNETRAVDVYILADNTGSMTLALSDVRRNALRIFQAVRNITHDVYWGVGAYRDIGDDFVFRSFLPLTRLPQRKVPESRHPVLNAIHRWDAAGGGDRYEAQLFALQQIATLEGIGWRKDSKRIIVWFGDAPGHDPRKGISRSQAIRALNNARIQVLAIDVGELNRGEQAELVADGTDGRYTRVRIQHARVPETTLSPIRVTATAAATATGTGTGTTLSRGSAIALSTSESQSNHPGSVVSNAIISGITELLSH